MIKAILFDIDNTLMDFAMRKSKSIDASIFAMQESGLDLEFNTAKKEIYEIYDKVGIENQNIFQIYLESKNIYNNYKLLARAIYAYRKVKDLETKTYPKVKKIFIEFIKKGITLGIISDAPRLQAHLRLVELGLEDFFEFVLTPEDLGNNKTTTIPFEKAKEILGLEANEILFVGDRPDRDILNAKKIGMKTAFAAYGYYGGIIPKEIPKEDFEKIKKEYNPDFILERFEDILKVIN
jgi:putative hydrolase of the HAD superfamily